MSELPSRIWLVDVVDRVTGRVVATAAVDSNAEATFILNVVARDDRRRPEEYEVRRKPRASMLMKDQPNA